MRRIKRGGHQHVATPRRKRLLLRQQIVLIHPRHKLWHSPHGLQVCNKRIRLRVILQDTHLEDLPQPRIRNPLQLDGVLNLHVCLPLRHQRLSEELHLRFSRVHRQHVCNPVHNTNAPVRALRHSHRLTIEPCQSHQLFEHHLVIVQELRRILRRQLLDPHLPHRHLGVLHHLLKLLRKLQRHATLVLELSVTKNAANQTSLRIIRANRVGDLRNEVCHHRELSNALHVVQQNMTILGIQRLLPSLQRNIRRIILHQTQHLRASLWVSIR